MNQFKCKKCGYNEYRRKGFKIHGKSMQDYRRKLTHQNPASVNKISSKVVCKKCKFAQKL